MTNRVWRLEKRLDVPDGTSGYGPGDWLCGIGYFVLPALRRPLLAHPQTLVDAAATAAPARVARVRAAKATIRQLMNAILPCSCLSIMCKCKRSAEKRGDVETCFTGFNGCSLRRMLARMTRAQHHQQQRHGCTHQPVIVERGGTAAASAGQEEKRCKDGAANERTAGLGDGTAQALQAGLAPSGHTARSTQPLYCHVAVDRGTREGPCSALAAYGYAEARSTSARLADSD